MHIDKDQWPPNHDIYTGHSTTIYDLIYQKKMKKKKLKKDQEEEEGFYKLANLR